MICSDKTRGSAEQAGGCEGSKPDLGSPGPYDPLPSDLQVAIAFSSFFVCRSRDIIFHLPHLTVFPWISAAVL